MADGITVSALNAGPQMAWQIKVIATPARETLCQPARLAVVSSHPIQYQCPIWQKLAGRPDTTLRVFFGSDFSVRGYHDKGFGQTVRWADSLLAGYDHQSLSSSPINSFFFAGSLQLLQRLRDFQPTACLINGYSPLLYWHTVVVCRWLGIPLIMRAETTDVDRHRGPLHRVLRDTVLKIFYAQLSGFLAIGHNSRQHYQRLGVRPQRCGLAPYCVDSDLFEQQYKQRVPGKLRQSLSIPSAALVVLFSGKLIEKKDPFTLLDAIVQLPTVAGRPVHSIFLGDGNLRQSLEQKARESACDRVHFIGWQPQEKLGEVYADADMLVLPSVFSETWGLVVNEAMQFGVPCIVSDRVGCGPDLIRDSETGFIFPHGDAAALRLQIAKLASLLVSKREQIHAACRDRVALYSVAAAAAGIAEALTHLPAARISLP